jgi:hypothetical protein
VPPGPGGVGAFTLSVAPVAGTPVVLKLEGGKASAKGKLTEGSFRPSSGPFSVGPPSGVYLLELETDKAYQIDMKAAKFDAFLRLEDADGNVVASDDDSGEGLNARLTFRCRSAGPYYLFASTAATPLKLGDFTVTVRQEE